MAPPGLSHLRCMSETAPLLSHPMTLSTPQHKSAQYHRYIQTLSATIYGPLTISRSLKRSLQVLPSSTYPRCTAALRFPIASVLSISARLAKTPSSIRKVFDAREAETKTLTNVYEKSQTLREKCTSHCQRCHPSTRRLSPAMQPCRFSLKSHFLRILSLIQAPAAKSSE
jgi:hypothetical protein